MRTLRIFISSPSDVVKERERAREVVESLRRRYSRHFLLQPVLWEDLPLQPDMSFQRGIDTVLSEQGVDIAIFIIWSRLGSPVGHEIPKPDGSPYRSGTEREYDLIIQARAAAQANEGKPRPDILVYSRRDDASFEEALRGTSTGEKEELIRQKKLVEDFLAETFRDQDTGHNIGAYFPFDRPVTFSQRLRAHLQNLLDQMTGESVEVIWDTEIQGPPFLGLEAFQPRHAPVFFGREEEILEVRHALKEQARNGCAFLLLTGASGSGKSSLARAGVLPAIVELELDEQIAGWRSLVLTPSQLGADLISSLVSSLATDDLLPSLREGESALPDLVAGLKKDPELSFSLRLKDAFAKISAQLGGAVRLLLVLDQLEELFTTSDLSATDRTGFLAVIETFARSGSVWVLAAVRSDFYQQVQLESALVRMKSGNGQLDVLPPGPDALQRIIEEPARLAGLTFETRETDTQSLASRIIKDAATHAELLPLVEFVLRELYEQRSDTCQLGFAAYEALGGVEGALAKCADATYAALPGDAQESLATVLQALVTLGNDSGSDSANGEKVVRQRTSLSEFNGKPAAKRLIDAFIAARLFTTCKFETTGDPAVTIAHECLLRVWPRAIAWAEHNRDFLRTRSRIAARMKEASPLLEGDPLLESAKAHLTLQAEAFSPDQAKYVRDATTAAEDRSRRRARRRRLAFTGLSILTVLALIGGTIAWQMKTVADGQKEIANEQRAKVTQQRDQQEALLWTASRGDHEAALRASDEHQYADSLGYFERALEYRPMNTAALAVSAAHAYGINAPAWRMRSVFEFGGGVSCVSFSPDGRYLAAVSDDKTARVIELETGKEMSKLTFEDGVTSVCFSPDGRYLAAASRDKTVRVIEAVTGRETKQLRIGFPVAAVSFSTDSRCLAAGSDVKAVRVIDVETGKEISNLPFEYHVTSVCFSPDGCYLATGSQDRILKVIETATGSVILEAEYPEMVTSVCFSPDGSNLAVGSSGTDEGKKRSIVGVIGVATRRGQIIKIDFREKVSSVCFSPDSRFLAVGSDDKSARVIDVATGREISKVEFGDVVTSLSFSADGRYLAAGSVDHTVRVLEAKLGGESSQLESGVPPVTSVGFSSDGRCLAVGNLNNTVRVFEAATGKEICKVSFVPGKMNARHQHPIGSIETMTGSEVFDAIPVTSLSFSPDGRLLAAGSGDETVRVIKSATGMEISKTKFDDDVNSVSFSPDGIVLAAGSSDKTAKVIEAATGREISRVEFGASVISVCFSSDGCHYAAAGSDHTIRVIEAATGKEISNVKVDGSVTSVGFSSDGRCLAVVGLNNTVRVIEVVTGKEIHKLETGATVTSSTYSPNGSYLAMLIANVALVIEVATGNEVSKLELRDRFTSLVFSPDGRCLAVGNGDSTARVIACEWFSPHEDSSMPWSAALRVQSGLRFLPDGRLSRLSPDELIAAQRDVSSFISTKPKQSEKWQHSILKWSRMRPEERTTSPWTNEPIRSAVGRRLMQAYQLSAITVCADHAPWHPLEPVSLARRDLMQGGRRPSRLSRPSSAEAEPKPANRHLTPLAAVEPQPENRRPSPVSGLRVDMLKKQNNLPAIPIDTDYKPITIPPQFLARLTLKRLRDADEKLYGRDTLAEYAAWAAKIMHEELQLNPEALEALTFALERTPEDKQQPLLDLKARLIPAG